MSAGPRPAAATAAPAASQASQARQVAPLITVQLHGPLAAKYGGGRYRFRARNPRQCLQAIEANFPGFRADFLAQPQWALLVDGDWRPGDIAATAPCAKRVDICPVIEGRAFLGAAVIGFLIPSIAGTAAANILGGLLVTGLLLGVSMFLAPKAKKKVTEDAKKDESFLFSGPDQVTGQGSAVPLAYGRVFVGSTVVSAALTTEDIAIGAGTSLSAPARSFAARARATSLRSDEPAIIDHWRGPQLIRGPEGWVYVGEQTILFARLKMVLPLWVSPDGSESWDEKRGFMMLDGGGWP